MESIKKNSKIIKLSIVLTSILIITTIICINYITSFAQGNGSVAIKGIPCETRTLIADTKEMSGSLTYQWKVCDEADGEYVDINGATKSTYTLPNDTYCGKYIKVIVTDSIQSYTSISFGAIGDIVELNVSYGVITIGDNGKYTYVDTDGTSKTYDHNENNYYMITGSTGTDSDGSGHNIRLAGDGNFNVILSNVSIYTGIVNLGKGAPLSTSNVTGSGNINVYIDGNNTMKNISKNVSDSCAGLEKTDLSSCLIIQSWNDNCINNSDSLDVCGGADSAGIGGSDTIYSLENYSSHNNGPSKNIKIMSGIINVTTTGSHGAGIGAGNNREAINIEIYGGDITATGIENGAGIGGSGGGSGDGNNGIVHIYGGKITAHSNGNGASIGGGGSNDGQGAAGEVTISGGTIKADKIGGGSSKKSGYCDATITITGGSINTGISGIPTDGTNQVYLTAITLCHTDSIKSNISVNSIDEYSNYGIKDVKTDESGILYLWVPNTNEITRITAQDNCYEGHVCGGCAGVLKYNSTQSYYTVSMGIGDRYRVYKDSSLSNEVYGSTTVQSNTNLELYVKKNDNYEDYTINAYKSKSDGRMESISLIPGANGEYLNSFIVKSDTLVWFETIYNEQSRLDLNLSNGNVIIEEDKSTAVAGDFIVTQNGYTLSGYKGSFYITSKGRTTNNYIVVKSGNVDILLDDIIANTTQNVIDVKGGMLNLTCSAKDNQITSSSNSPIGVRDGAVMNICISETNSLKAYAGTTYPSIAGDGTINISKAGGFLVLTKGESASSQIAARNYSYTTAYSNGVLPFTFKPYEGTLIGYKRDSDNALCEKNAIQSVSEQTTFTAFTVKYSLISGVTHENETITNNGFAVTLSGADCVNIRRDGNELIAGSDYDWNSQTKVLSIPGFNSYGNVIISVMATNEILYETTTYCDNYDNSDHTISIQLISPIDATIKYGTTSDNCNLTIAPKYKDVGTYIIYYEISKENYTTVKGCQTVIITKADNEWIDEIICSSVLEGTPLNPRATAKWGEVKYEYSTLLNGEYVSAKPVASGTYYVRANVAGTDNYNSLLSSSVKVLIEPFGVYMQDGRIISQLDDSCKKNSLLTNDVFTIKYDISYVPDNNNQLKLVFDKELPVGTSFTLIDFCGSNPIYYDFLLKEAASEIALTSFERFATDDIHFQEHESGIAVNVRYQINVNLINPMNANELTTNLYKGDTAIHNLTATATLNARYCTIGNVTIKSITTNISSIDITLNVSATGLKNKVLCLQIMDFEGTTISYPIGTVISLDALHATTYSNFASFNLGKDNIENKDYVIKITGIKAGRYKFNASICSSDVTNYPMRECIDSKASDMVTVMSTSEYGMQVTAMAGQERSVAKEEDIDVTIKYNVPSEVKLKVKRVKKSNNAYDGQRTDELFKISTCGDNFGTDVSDYVINGTPNTDNTINLRLKASNEKGTYRYIFYLQYADKELVEIPYNFIVK